MNNSNRTPTPQTAAQTSPALAAALLLSTLALPAQAQIFVTSDRTSANSNPFVNGGTLRATGAQSGIAGGTGSVINVSGGLVQSLQGAALDIAQDSALTMTGGTVTGDAGGVAQRGVRLDGVNLTAALRGGTVNGGVRADAASNQVALQAGLGGNVAVNGGVFAYGNSALNVSGGNYTRFAGADASFFAMGSNSISFFGTNLALSGPTAGNVFELNNHVGNFYTFTSGTFADGQSALGLRLFDAVSLAATQLGGGFTLNPSPVPEPAAWLLLLLALPAVGAIARGRRRAAPATGQGVCGRCSSAARPQRMPGVLDGERLHAIGPRIGVAGLCLPAPRGFSGEPAAQGHGAFLQAP